MKASDADDLFAEYVKQLDELQSENRQLKQLISQQSAEAVAGDEGGPNFDLIKRLGPEIYPGEIYDRLRFAVQTTLSYSDTIGLDPRSGAILRRIIERIPRSPALDELLLDLSRATKNPKRIADDLTALLCRHGYQSKSDNKHIRLEPLVEYVGLNSITIPKTPGENRGLQNQRKQIERTLGIGKIPK